MKNIFKLLVILTCIAVISFFVFKDSPNVGASVIQGGEYKATSTKAYNGVSLTNLTVLKSESGTLGSVVITGATAVGTINLYDATTTDATKRTKTATTTLITIPATTLANTYTYDISFYNGLIVELLGTVGTSTVTFR